MNSRILIVDDDELWRLALTDTLSHEGYEVAGVSSGVEALAQMQTLPVHLVILDVQIPDKHGYEVCLEIRRRPAYVPIIMISGVKKELVDREIGLHLGADHYFEKPAEPREIVAQVRALLRMAGALRTTGESAGWLDIDEHLRIHMQRGIVMAGGAPVELTPQEFGLLQYLVQKAGTPCTRDDLIENVWGVASVQGVSDGAINTMMARLRGKIEPDPHNPRYILTVNRWGYKFRNL